MIEEKLHSSDAKPGIPFTDEQIDWIEGKIGVSLPDTYRWMLKNYGAATFNSVRYFDPEYDMWDLMDGFYTFNELARDLRYDEEVLPVGIIPIGDDICGNLYCLGVTGNDRDKVFYHDHSIGWHSDADQYVERGEPVPANIRYQTVHLLADSFESFIDGMSREE